MVKYSDPNNFNADAKENAGKWVTLENYFGLKFTGFRSGLLTHATQKYLLGSLVHSITMRFSRFPQKEEHKFKLFERASQNVLSVYNNF